MNVISVLQKIAAQATTVEGRKVAPVAWESQLPGRGLRGLHDGHQRPRPPGLHRAGRPAAGRPAGRDRTPPDEPVSRPPRPGRRSHADVSVARAGQGLGPGRRLLRPRPRTAAIAGRAGTGLPADRVHDLRLLPGGLPAVLEDRTAAGGGRRVDATTRQEAPPTIEASSAPTRSARRCSSTPIRSAR